MMAQRMRIKRWPPYVRTATPEDHDLGLEH